MIDNLKMPCWYYEKRDLKNTPSRQDGIEYETERRYRKEGARFIMQTGTLMQLGHNTIATGVVYFHRFYMFQSFKTFPRYVTACCCLFLAGKVEETPKKCKDIIKTAKGLLSDEKFASFGDDPKEEVMTLERILLQTIKFDLQVEHPYSFLVKYAKCLKGDTSKLQKLVQMAWNFVNDSLSTTLSLQWEPEIIAVALIYLASKLSKFTVTDWQGKTSEHLKWWDMFVENVTMEILEDICHQVLDLYQQGNEPVPDSPPQLPPSKASPPMKRANISPSKSAKSSPQTTNNVSTTKASISSSTSVVSAPASSSATSSGTSSLPPSAAAVPEVEGNPIPNLVTAGDNYYAYNAYPPYNYTYSASGGAPLQSNASMFNNSGHPYQQGANAAQYPPPYYPPQPGRQSYPYS